MTPEQALQFLLQTLVVKPGLSVQEIANVVAAWNLVAEALTKKPEPQLPTKEAE